MLINRREIKILRNKKNWKKVLYVAAPVLWFGLLYMGSENSLGTVLAKSVTTMTQTVTAAMTEMTTQTMAETVTGVGQVTMTTAVTQTMVPTEVNDVVNTMAVTMVEVPTNVVTMEDVVTETSTQTESHRTEVSRTIFETTEQIYYTQTVVPTMTQMQVTKQGTTECATEAATSVPTVIRTEIEQQTDMAVMTETMGTTVMATMTETVYQTMTETMTEVVTVIEDGKDVVIDQIIPSEAPEKDTEPKKDTAQNVKKAEVWAPVVAQGWKPQTVEEKERASYVTKEKVIVTKGSNLVSVLPAMQGPECIKAMKSALKSGYQIANTYNIKYIANKSLKQPVYSSEDPVTVTMSIPKDLIKEGRTFEMICVTEGGQTHNIPAQVDENGNLTFTTKYFYAFALVYKD